jgi:peptide/nickel transport system substrate-binding protein
MSDPTSIDNHSDLSSPDLQPNSTAPPTEPAAVTVTPPTERPEHQPVPELPAGRPRRRGLKIVVLIVVLIVVVGGGWWAYKALKTNNTPTGTVKHDIPLLRYGGAEGEVPQYPVNEQDSNFDIQIAAQLFEGLVQYRDQTKLVPWLAVSWSNPNDTTWIFNLRHGVKFHSGRTMTAADVKYTLDYVVAHQNDFDDSSILALASTIKEVDVVNSYQVKIITNGPDSLLLNRLSYFGIVDSKAKLGDYDAGTGPYVVKPGTTPTSTSIDLVASNNYWAGHIYTREVQVTINTNDDQLAAQMAAGKYDLGGDFDGAEMSDIKGAQTINVPDLGPSYLGLATERAGSPLQSLAGREAVADALNVPAILKASGRPGVLSNQLVPLILPGHDPSIPNTTYDPAKAKQLLATAPNPTMQLTLGYPNNDTPQANEMAKDLTAVGFNVKLVQVSDFGAFINDTTAGKYDLFYLSYTTATVDGFDILSTLLLNNQDYDNPQIDSLLAQVSTTFDPSTRIELMQQVDKLVYNDKPILPLYDVTRTYALTKPYVIKVDMPSLGPSTYFWQVYQK